jgi:hypothetical protein
VVAENGIATLTGTIADPNETDSFTVSVNWGDTVTNETFLLPSGTTNFLATHRYLDDGQTGTASDNYPMAVTVTDSAGVSDQDFLSALLQDLLARPFDVTLLAYYENQIGVLGLQGTVSQLLAGLEYRSKKTRDYFQQFLHRDATGGEQSFYASSPLSERDIVSSILASAEYFTVRAGNSNASWLTAVFYDLLKRQPSAIEVNFCLNLIAQNGRSSTATALLGTLEFRQVLVESWFQKFLHRAGGASAGPFVSALAAQTWEQVMSAILGSTEYYNVRSGGTAFAWLSITVTNVPPLLSNVSAASPITEGGITSVSGQISDPGSLDTFLLQIDWADGSPVQALTLTNGATFFNVPHLFSTPHTTNLVQITLTDDDGGVAWVCDRRVTQNQKAGRREDFGLACCIYNDTIRSNEIQSRSTPSAAPDCPPRHASHRPPPPRLPQPAVLPLQSQAHHQTRPVFCPAGLLPRQKGLRAHSRGPGQPGPAGRG